MPEPSRGSQKAPKLAPGLADAGADASEERNPAAAPHDGCVALEPGEPLPSQAFEDLEAFAKLPLADMNATPMVRMLLLTREGRLAEALAVIHATAAISYPLAYAHVHARLRPPDEVVERELDHGLRTFCPEG